MEESSIKSGSVSALSCPSDQRLQGRADVCSGCPGKSLCLNQSETDSDQKFIDVRMNAIKRKILIVSGKGGVGKSSIAASLSMALTKLCGENKVGILDLDICGPSVPKLLKVEGMTVINTDYGWRTLKSIHGGIKVMSSGSLLAENKTAVVWRGPRKTELIKRFIKDTFWGRLDYLIFDTPPGTSDEHLTVIKLLMNTNPEGAIIVTTSQEIALATIRKEINFCQKMNLPILGMIENMSGYTCPCCNEHTQLFSQGGAEKLAEDYQIPFLGRLPLDPNFVECCEEGRSVIDDHPSSSSTLAIMKIAQMIHRPH